MIKTVKFLILIFCSIGLITAQERPFPQNIKYPHGFIPTTLNSDWVKSEYERWKGSALATCSGDEIYVKTDNGGKVEAVGFGNPDLRPLIYFANRYSHLRE